MVKNLEIWDNVRKVPEAAQKKITGGRLNGKTDINPMYRLKTLTEQFGPCGIGWKYVITAKWLEKSPTDEIKAFVDIDLFIQVDGKWSDAIPGTGGSSFVEKESKGLYTSDECFKMALTDALSVACKALGVGADVYWAQDPNKYTPKPQEKKPEPDQAFLTDGETVIGPQDHKTLVMLVADETGKKPDQAKLQTMMGILKNLGYAKLSEVKIKDFQQIYTEFNSLVLPDALK